MSSGKKISRIQIISIFITNPNMPKVIILNGNVIFFRMGLMKKLSNPKIAPAVNNFKIEPLKSTPGTKMVANQSPKIVNMI